MKNEKLIKTTCPDCGGSGKDCATNHPCSGCGGSGTVWEEENE